MSQQLDDFCAGVEEPNTADTLYNNLGKDIDLVQQGLLEKFNGIDIDQRNEYVKIYALSYLNKILDNHGWNQEGKNKETEKPIKPLTPSTLTE